MLNKARHEKNSTGDFKFIFLLEATSVGTLEASYFYDFQDLHSYRRL